MSLIDQIALCAAGREAQKMFVAPTHSYAGLCDQYRMSKLVAGLSETDGETLRYAGYQRAHEILNMDRGEVEQLAKRLLREKRIEFS